MELREPMSALMSAADARSSAEPRRQDDRMGLVLRPLCIGRHLAQRSFFVMSGHRQLALILWMSDRAFTFTAWQGPQSSDGRCRPGIVVGSHILSGCSCIGGAESTWH